MRLREETKDPIVRGEMSVILSGIYLIDNQGKCNPVKCTLCILYDGEGDYCYTKFSKSPKNGSTTLHAFRVVAAKARLYEINTAIVFDRCI